MANHVDAQTAQFGSLSAAEIQCLLLVAEGVATSKAIAAVTGLSPGTIDTYLSRAAKAMGARSRKEAAARYLEMISISPTQEQSQSSSQSRSDALSTLEPTRFSALATGARWLFSVPPISGPEHSLNWIEKTLAIVRIASVSLCALAILVLVGAGLLWISR